MNTTRTTRHTRFVQGLALLTAVGLFAGACSDDDDAGETAPTVEDTSSPTEPSVADTTSDPTSPPTTPESTATPTSPPVETSERANFGPTDIDAYLRDVLQVQLDQAQLDPPNDAECAGLPYMKDELLVYVAPEIRVETTADLWTKFLQPAVGELTPDPEENQLPVDIEDEGNPVTSPAGPVFRITLSPGLLSVAAVATANEVLGGLLDEEGWPEDSLAVDVDHVGPFLPVGTFHPGGDPVPTTGTPTSLASSNGGNHSVLVVDSPELSNYDVFDESWDGNPTTYAKPDPGMVDFVAGHGPFVVDLITRLAPGSPAEPQRVVLSEVEHQSSGSGPAWPGFLFTEADLIRALEFGLGATPDGVIADGVLPTREFTDSFDLINMSLGTFGCGASPHPVLAGVFRDVFTPVRYRPDLEEGELPYVVAAAGNDGVVGQPQRPHYPAAFADPQYPFSSNVLAVGATVEPGATSYSNTCWVNVWAPGEATAAFPWLGGPGFAEWTGTSFATARVTAVLADAPDPIAATWAATTPSGPVGADSATVREPNPACVP